MARDSGYRALGPGALARRRAVRAKALVTPLSDLEDAPLQPLRGQVEVAAAELLAVEPDAAAREESPRLGARHAEVLAEERRQVHRIGVGKLRLLDLVGQRALDVEAVEVGLGLRGGIL